MRLRSTRLWAEAKAAMSGTTRTRAKTAPAITVSPASTNSSSTMPLICGLMRISLRGPMVPELTDFLMMSAMRGVSTPKRACGACSFS